MTNSACLHIQGRTSDPIRVVDLRGGTVRIGRAAFCDVRLSGPEFATEECQLRSRNGAWQISPINRGPGAVRLGGVSLREPRPLEWGETFCLGSTSFTLQPACEASTLSTAGDPSESTATAAFVEARGTPLLGGWNASSERRDRWQQTRLETKRWEARWKAAGEKLKASPARGHAKPTTSPTPIDPGKPSRRASDSRTSVARGSTPKPRLAVQDVPAPIPPLIRDETSVESKETGKSAWVLIRKITTASRAADLKEASEPPVEAGDAQASSWDETNDEPTFEQGSRPLLGTARRLDPVAQGVANGHGAFHARDFLGRVEDFDPTPGEPSTGYRGVIGLDSSNAPSASPSSASHSGISAETPGQGTEKASDQDLKWPTVRDILAAQGAESRPVREIKRGAKQPLPTVVAEPGQWEVPLLVGWTPALALALSVGIVGMMGAYAWAVDGYNAGIVTRRLASEGQDHKPLPEGVAPGSFAWWATTPTHLTQWASLRNRQTEEPSSREESRFLMNGAARLSPLDPVVRSALASSTSSEGVEQLASVAQTLGQSRDVVTLAKTGRRLLLAGKKSAALQAYGQAIAMAAGADPSRPGLPEFLESLEVRRYALPSETLLAYVIGDMAGSEAWTYKEWAASLPRGTAAPVVAARVLQDKGRPEAEVALAEALQGMGKVDLRSRPTDQAVQLAAEGALLTMARRWDDARERYSQAIERMPIESVRRAWWMNIAHLALRTNDDSTLRLALESAKNADPKDEITRRAVVFQKSPGYLANRSTARKDAAVEKVAGTRP